MPHFEQKKGARRHPEYCWIIIWLDAKPLATWRGRCDRLVAEFDFLDILECITIIAAILLDIGHIAFCPNFIIAGIALIDGRIAALTTEKNIVPLTTLESVIALAADQGVIALAAIELVVTLTAGQDITTITTVQGVVALAAEQHIVALAAIDGVIATLAKDDIILVCAIERVIAVGANHWGLRRLAWRWHRAWSGLWRRAGLRLWRIFTMRRLRHGGARHGLAAFAAAGTTGTATKICQIADQPLKIFQDVGIGIIARAASTTGTTRGTATAAIPAALIAVAIAEALDQLGELRQKLTNFLEHVRAFVTAAAFRLGGSSR